MLKHDHNTDYDLLIVKCLSHIIYVEIELIGNHSQLVEPQSTGNLPRLVIGVRTMPDKLM